jgi:hypothetical protein
MEINMTPSRLRVHDPGKKEDDMPEEPVTFPCEDFELEGILHLPDGKARGNMSVVVAHPHPMFGGSMENMVVRRICEAISSRGVRSLRFNFRGVGASGGFHNRGGGGVDDVLSAMGYMRGKRKKAPVGLAGYSFGASMAVLAARKDKSVKRIACVALPLGLINLGPAEFPKGQELLLIAGNSDTVAPVSELRTFAEMSKGRARLEVLRGADHFFGGKMGVVAKLVADFLVGDV